MPSKNIEHGAVCLGQPKLVAQWNRGGKWEPVIYIQYAADVYEGVYVPAASIPICGRTALIALREAINQALEE